MIVIKGGNVLTARGWALVDVAISDGLVLELGEDLTGEVVIEATGCLVGPAFVDLHTHLREPGQTWKEDIASGSRAAATGGFAAVVTMPNTDPPIDSPKVVEAVMTAGSQVGLVDVVPAGAMTRARAGAVPADIDGLYGAGVRLFTDDGDSVEDATLLHDIMTTIAGLPGALVAQHAEDSSLSAGGHMHDGDMARRLGVRGLPSDAEFLIVARDLDLVSQTGAHYHCQHVSAERTIDLIRVAKQDGLAVTAEVTPHHLTFDETYLSGLDPDFKMYPPLRTADDRDALREALGDGTIDLVATDHAPHLPEEKHVEFSAAPRGVIGLETAASAVWETLRDPDRFFEVLSIAPAGIVGLTDHGCRVAVGTAANLVVFDPTSEWVPDEFVSRSANSPYRGRTMRGRVRATIHSGGITYQNGAWHP